MVLLDLRSSELSLIFGSRQWGTSTQFALGKGVRQGDPISPALFILAIDALQAMLSWAASQNLLVKLGVDARTPRASIFADDAIIFFCSSCI